MGSYFYTYVFHLLDFDAANMILFDMKYFFLIGIESKDLNGGRWNLWDFHMDNWPTLLLSHSRKLGQAEFLAAQLSCHITTWVSTLLKMCLVQRKLISRKYFLYLWMFRAIENYFFVDYKIKTLMTEIDADLDFP